MSKLYTQISIFRPKMCFFKPPIAPNRSTRLSRLVQFIHPFERYWTTPSQLIMSSQKMRWPKKIFRQKKMPPFILHSKNKSHTHTFWPPWRSTHLVALTIARRLWKSCQLCHWPGPWELCPLCDHQTNLLHKEVPVWICDFTISLMVKFTFHITKS